MRFRQHWHVLTHLVIQHHTKKKPSFHFSEHVPLSEQTIEVSHRQQRILELEEELLELKSLLTRIPKTHEKHQVFVKKISELESVISEKKNR